MNNNDFVVHLVDDEEVVRSSLSFLLTSLGYAVQTHSSATSFLRLAPTLRNCCLLTDLRMPGMNGVEMLQRLRDMHVHIPAIVISGHGDIPMAVQAMRAGALDFIEKPFKAEMLTEALTRAAAELSAMPTMNGGEIYERFRSLTDREREVLKGVVGGFPNKTIAFNLNISPRTVEVHRATVMLKMQARTLPELVRMSIAARLFPTHLEDGSR